MADVTHILDLVNMSKLTFQNHNSGLINMPYLLKLVFMEVYTLRKNNEPDAKLYLEKQDGGRDQYSDILFE